MYQLIFTDKALKSLKSVPRKDVVRIVEQLESLSVNPDEKIKCEKADKSSASRFSFASRELQNFV